MRERKAKENEEEEEQEVIRQVGMKRRASCIRTVYHRRL